MRSEVVRAVSPGSSQTPRDVDVSGSSLSDRQVIVVATLGPLAQASPPLAVGDAADPLGFDPFRQAVDIAGQAAVAGQTAQSSAQWLNLAVQWQQAADLMAVVPPTDRRYNTAQNRIIFYRRNYKLAQQLAKQRRVTNSIQPRPPEQDIANPGSPQPISADGTSSVFWGWSSNPLVWLGLFAIATLAIATGRRVYTRKQSVGFDGNKANPVRNTPVAPPSTQRSLAYRYSDGGQVDAIPVPVSSDHRDRAAARPSR